MSSLYPSEALASDFCSLCMPTAQGRYRRRIEDCQHGTGSPEGKQRLEEEYAASRIQERQNA